MVPVQALYVFKGKIIHTAMNGAKWSKHFRRKSKNPKIVARIKFYNMFGHVKQS